MHEGPGRGRNKAKLPPFLVFTFSSLVEVLLYIVEGLLGRFLGAGRKLLNVTALQLRPRVCFWVADIARGKTRLQVISCGSATLHC